MKINNPFPIYGYFGPDYFCDRVLESAKIVEALENERNVTLIAPRRLGKTGLIHHVMRQLEGRAKCVYLDIFSVKTLPQFVQVLAGAVFSTLETRLEKVTKAAGSFLSSCRPNLSIDTLTGTPTLSFGVERGQAENTLREVFDYLKSKDERIVLAIDEFQQVAEFPESGTEALLRSYIQFLPNVRFIFSGSRQHLMAEMFLSAKRPFYKSTQNISISPIDADVYFDFATEHFKKGGRALDRDAFDFAYRLVDGVTWEMQTVLNRLWSKGDRQVDLERVRKAMLEILDENAEDYRNTIANLTRNEAAVLSAVASARRVNAPTGAEFLAATGLPPSSIVQTLKRLVESQLVYQSAEEGYLVYDRFMGMWLNHSRS